MSGVILFQDRADQICTELGIEPASARPIGLGLCFAEREIDPDLAERVAAMPGAGLDRGMGVLVEGQPMDVHGNGIPQPSEIALSSRLDNWVAPNADDPMGSGEGVLVGVVDSGIVPNSWLNGGYLAAPDDFEPTIADLEGAPADQAPLEIGHGTFAAGLILQQAPAAGVWVERALKPEGSADATKVLEKAETLARRGVDILNLSLGAYADDDEAHDVMARMVSELQRINPKMVIVAAAGNLRRTAEKTKDNPEGFECPKPFWPAALPWGVVAVGAYDESQQRLARWSNGGSWLDLAAPGVALKSTYIEGSIRTPDGKCRKYHGWAEWSGTSFATAVVSGAIAAVMTGRNGRISAQEAVYALRSGKYSSVRTAADPAHDTPSVPVVPLRDRDIPSKAWRPAQ